MVDLSNETPPVLENRDHHMGEDPSEQERPKKKADPGAKALGEVDKDFKDDQSVVALPAAIEPLSAFM